MARRPREEMDLSLEQIVAAAVELLDEHGLRAFSMRGLGAKLGCSAMAPYRYVDSREDLLLLAVERVEAPPPELGQGPWYERLEMLMRDEWAYTWPDHPWIIDIWQQGILDPRASGRLDCTAQIYRQAGFDPLDQALLAHWSFIVGTLGVIRALEATSGHVIDASPGEVFEFNLSTYIAGVRSMASSSPPPPRPQTKGKRTSGHTGGER
jgi:AcrR family transcriptional regulator